MLVPEVSSMNLQFAFLLVFIAGGLSAWILIRASRQAKQERMAVIKNKIGSIGGHVFNIELDMALISKIYVNN